MTTRKYHNGEWDGKSVFVFGSNKAGRHGAGAAKYAVENCGAVYGRGYGLSGNSLAIPSKDRELRSLSLEEIQRYINHFLAAYAQDYDREFFVTALGTGLAGYKHSDIAPMFKDAPDNCVFPVEWKEFLE